MDTRHGVRERLEAKYWVRERQEWRQDTESERQVWSPDTESERLGWRPDADSERQG